MLKRGTGYFVNTASAAGLLSHIDSITYSTTKHAAIGLAEWLAISYGKKGVWNYRKANGFYFRCDEFTSILKLSSNLIAV